MLQRAAQRWRAVTEASPWLPAVRMTAGRLVAGAWRGWTGDCSVAPGAAGIGWCHPAREPCVLPAAGASTFARPLSAGTIISYCHATDLSSPPASASHPTRLCASMFTRVSSPLSTSEPHTHSLLTNAPACPNAHPSVPSHLSQCHQLVHQLLLPLWITA